MKQPTPAVPFWNSIVSRFALFFTGLIVFSILLSGYLVYRKAARVITEHSKERIQYAADLAENTFYSMLAEVSNDIAVISSSPTLSNYIENPTADSESELGHLFSTTLEYKPSYFQVRLIGADGNEVVRYDKSELIGLNRITSEIKRAGSESLQYKGDRTYFKEAVRVNKGELYFSRINLNEEHGEVSSEYVPTLRAASPIYDKSDKLAGVVVINVDLNRLYRALDQISASGPQIHLIDESGQYLYTQDAQKQFGEQLHNDFTFTNDYNISMTSVSALNGAFGNLKGNEEQHYLSFVKRFSYFKGIRKVYLITTVEEELLLQSARMVRTESLQTLSVVCIISILLSYFFARLFSSRINMVTQAMSRYEQEPVKLPEGRKDEIGILARTFNKMRTTIDQQMSELNDALGKEKAAKKQRDEFLQNMSHEMRTPLNAILGLTQLLYKNAPHDAQLPILTSLDRSANNLAGLVYDVLDHQKLVEGKVNIQQKPTDINELLRDIHSGYQYEAVNKGLSFELRVDDRLKQQTVLTDPLRLSQIVVNLVVNAIKYTERGKVILKADLTDDDRQTLHIRVIDTGIGILPENISRINDRFFQERDELSGRYGGYGLGLSIVKQLVLLFGGTLEAVSTKNAGSEFYVRIPVMLVQADVEPALKSNNQLPVLENRYTIVHIEDDGPTLDLLRFGLSDEQINLVQLSRLEDAVNYLRTHQPAIVISDFMLGEKMMGDTLQAWINSREVQFPVILVSAMEPSALKAVSPLYFQKPFELDAFLTLIYTILGSKEHTPPDLKNVYDSYDHQAKKISKVLKLLEGEFETYLNRVHEAITTRDQKEWEAIRHKLIAHINNLKLVELQGLAPDITALGDEEVARIMNVMRFYLCCFREERRINSAD